MTFSVLNKWSMKRLVWTVFILAFVWKGMIVLASGHYQIVAMGEVLQTGRALATKGLFGDPFRIPTGPTAHVAPVIAAIYGAVYSLFGITDLAQWVLALIGVLSAAATWALMVPAAEASGFGRRTAVSGAILGAIFPFEYRPETTFAEASVAPMLMMGLMVVSIRDWERGFGDLRRAFINGLAWGAALLTYPSLLPVLFVALLPALFRHLRQQGETARAAAFLLAAAVVLGPWTWRNHQEFGAFFFVRDNMGLELQVSNNDEAAPHTTDNNPRITHRIHPNRSQDECRKLIAMGEVAYNADKMRQFREWLVANPGRFMELSAWRAAYFWVPKRGGPIGYLCEALVTLFGLAGLWMAWKRGYRAAGFLLGVLAAYPAIYYVVQADQRYSYPVRWTLYLGCGYLLTLLADWNSARRKRLESAT